MVPGLRSRLALFAMMAAFLIPISTSTLRGLTHALACQQEVETPFTVVLHDDAPPEVLSSIRLERGEEEGLCGGLLVDIHAGEREGKIRLNILITNNTDSVWRGTVQMGLTGERNANFPVQIGSIEPGRTASDQIFLTLPSGSTELEGSLLLGP